MAAVLEIDRPTLRELIAHEARIQATLGREIRDLGDAILLHDPRNAEPYWNRLMAPDWPADPAAFDRRLDAAITHFATLGRMPHIWPYPGRNQPIDLVDRLVTAGFELMGSDVLMVLADPTPARARVVEPLPSSVSLERVHGFSPANVRAAAAVAEVLADAFGVGVERRASIELETLAALEGIAIHICLARVNGVPAAVAKRTTLDGSSYLSSIGTRRTFRGRGLGELVTAVVAADAVAAGSRWAYLKVYAENLAARRLYRGLGFREVPGEVDDLLLRQ